LASFLPASSPNSFGVFRIGSPNLGPSIINSFCSKRLFPSYRNDYLQSKNVQSEMCKCLDLKLERDVLHIYDICLLVSFSTPFVPSVYGLLFGASFFLCSTFFTSCSKYFATKYRVILPTY
jgi:hypothetical protein